VTPSLDDDSGRNREIFQPLQQVVQVGDPMTRWEIGKGKGKAKGKVADGVSQCEQRFLESKMYWLASVVGVGCKTSEGKVITPFDSDLLVTELEEFWKQSENFGKRLTDLQKRIETRHYDNFTALMGSSPEMTIAQANDALFNIVVSAALDKGGKYISMREIAESAEPFRYFAMRVPSDFTKTSRFSALDVESHSNGVLHRVMVGGEISTSDIPEHRKVLREVWDWFAAYRFNKYPYFLK
jgi:hypothetical protein